MDDLAVLLTDDPLPDVDKFAREIDGGFNGTLNEANLASVARLMTRIFEGRKVAIATCHYCDRGIDNRVKLVTDQEFYADWCDGKNDIIRYHRCHRKWRVYEAIFNSPTAICCYCNNLLHSVKRIE